MSPSFIHAADIHLGFQQYHSKDRADDFYAAFDLMIDDALERGVDFVLLSGDLFHKRNVDPTTLIQATVGLGRLRAADIPVIIIEGNHERPHRLDDLSWVDFLNDGCYAVALDAPYANGAMVYEAWSAESPGAYVDLPCGVRIVGVRYSGAATKRVVDDLAACMAENPSPPGASTIVMLHAGLEGIVNRYSASVRREDIEVLRPHCDYVALGHIHKPFDQDDWLYNPGSLETNGTDEVAWADRGYLVVNCETGDAPSHVVTRIPSTRRPFLLLKHGVDGHDSPQELYEAIHTLAEAQLQPQGRAKPVVRLRLTGILQFSRSDLDLGHVENILTEQLQPLLAMVKDETTPSEMEIRLSESQSRKEVERYVLTELAARDARRAPDASAWADMTLDLKRLALAETDPSEIIDVLGRFLDRPDITVDEED